MCSLQNPRFLNGSPTSALCQQDVLSQEDFERRWEESRESSLLKIVDNALATEAIA